MKTIIATFYGRFLEFINEMVAYDEGLLDNSSALEAQLRAQMRTQAHLLVVFVDHFRPE